MSYSMAFWEWDRCAGRAVQLCGTVVVLLTSHADSHADIVTVMWMR
jgi:hypothetical protein